MASVDFNRIASNIAALNALNSLRVINSRLGVAQTRLATGRRINEAADDPAGLSIATKLNSRSESMKVALNNISDAKNLLAVAEGGLAKMSDILIQIRSKSEQAASDTLGTTERAAIKQEIQSLAEQLQNIVDETKFNGAILLDGTVNKRFQTGTDDGEYTSFILTQAHDPTTMGVSDENLVASIDQLTRDVTSFTAVASLASVPYTGLTVLDTGNYEASIMDHALSAAVGKVNYNTALPTGILAVNAMQPTALANELSYSTTGSVASGGDFKVIIDDSDVAVATGTISYTVYDANGTQISKVTAQTYGTGAASIALQSGNVTTGASMGLSLVFSNMAATVANNTEIDLEYIAMDTVKVQLADSSGNAVAIDKDASSLTTPTSTEAYYRGGVTVDTGRGVKLTLGATAAVVTGQGNGFTYNEQGDYIVNVSTAAAASSYMSTIDTVIDTVNRSLASLGALTARMGAKEDTLATAQVNTEAAFNRIMNADMAAEQVNATKYGILQQTALAMLAQVNTGPQAILSLFR